jgi:hypothetical protein
MRSGHGRWRICLVAVVMGIAALMSCMPSGALGREDAPFLTYTVDDYKTAFVSSNLTAMVTNDWPRVAFYHTKDRFSPTFEIGMPAIYLFNDTNGDGLFVRSEISHLAYLDEHHNVTWNISDVVQGSGPPSGRYAVLDRWADVALYDSRVAVVPAVDRWARAHFSFKITENSTTYVNDLGNYVVQGRIDIRVDFALEIFLAVNCSGVVLEQSLKGGMNTNTFLLTEDLGLGYLVQTQALSRIDETVNGGSFAHRFNLTGLPTQRIDISKEDGKVQAHYRLSSVPVADDGISQTKPRMNCSHYTTGSGMMLHTAYMVPDANGTITHDMSLGLDEAGFYTGVRDWFTENLPAIMVATGSTVATASAVALIVIHRRNARAVAKTQSEQVEDGREKPPAS